MDQNLSLADQKIEECLNEESILVAPVTDAEKLANFHAMLNKFYNPYTHHSNLLSVDAATIADPQYIGEYVQANQGSIQN